MLRFARVFGIGAVAVLILVGLITQTVSAATIVTLTISCRRANVQGSVEVRAPFVRVQVTRADDLSRTLDTEVVRVRADGSYNATLNYPRQADGTLLIISAGEWNGVRYLRPATLTSRTCGQGTPTPVVTQPPSTPFPTPSPVVTQPPNTPYPTPVGSQPPSTPFPTPSPVVTQPPNTPFPTPTWVGTQPPNTPFPTPTRIGTQPPNTPFPTPTRVVTQPPNTPFPTPTFVPTSTVPVYHIAYFRADRTEIEAGACITLSYWVVGAQSVTLQGSNWPGGPDVITDNPNQRVVCPSAAGGYIPGQSVTYTLGVTYLDGRTDSASVTITFVTP